MKNYSSRRHVSQIYTARLLIIDRIKGGGVIIFYLLLIKGKNVTEILDFKEEQSDLPIITNFHNIPLKPSNSHLDSATDGEPSCSSAVATRWRDQ